MTPNPNLSDPSTLLEDTITQTRSSFHRGDYRRVRQSVAVAMIELESLEPRMQLAYKLEEIPAGVVADLSLARLMVTELDGLLRRALDVAISDTGEYYDIYSEKTYDARQLAGEKQ